jgi:FimV-like protein
MIELIIKSYLGLLISVSAGALCLFVAGLIFIFRKPQSHDSASRHAVNPVVPSQIKPAAQVSANVSIQDVHAIAGDDVIATQLDLARAFVEAGRKHLAKPILKQVMIEGSESQQQEARQLSGSC